MSEQNKSISFLATILIIYILYKFQIFAFTLDTVLPYIFFILLWGGVECRSEITFQNILSKVRGISIFLCIAVAIILAQFYTYYSAKCYIIAWFAWVILVLLISEVIAPLENVSKIFVIGATVLSILCSLGMSFTEDYSSGGYGWMLVKIFLLIFCWFILFLKSFLVVQRLIERYRHQYKPSDGKEYKNWIYFFSFLIIFLSYIPFFLVQYPGLLTGDSVHQMMQILGQESFSNHHPWYYTMLIGFFYKLGSLVVGTVNGGIATYTFFSVLFISGCCAYVITYLYKKGMRWYWLFLLEIVYAFDPIKAQMSVTMWKDVIFSGSLLVLCVLLADFQISLKWVTKIYVIGLLVCLTRNNGFLIFACTFLMLLFWHKQHKKFLCYTFFPVIFIYLIMTKMVMPFMGVEETEAVESLSIPLQQIAFAVCADGDINAEEYEMINAVVETNKIKEAYCAWKSDAIKNIVKSNEKIIIENKFQYLKLWIRIGIKNPYCYLKAYFEQTKGYWYHKVDYKVCEEEGAGGEIIGMVKKSLLPEKLTNKIKNWISIYIHRIYPNFYSLGLQTWVCIYFFIILLKNNDCWEALVPILLNIVTLLIATPVFAEFRYAYSAYLCIPLCVGMVLSVRSNETVCNL